MKLRLSIKQNLSVEVTLDEDFKLKNAGIQSYTTTVGFIEEGKIFEAGKFSRTTSKHMGVIRSITGLPWIFSKEKKYFWWLPYGVRISHENSLSPGSSLTVLKELASGKSLFEAVCNLNKIGKKDLEIIKGILGTKDEDLIEILDTYRKIKASFALL